MSEKLEQKAIEVIDKAMDGVEKLSNMLSDVAVQYGPEVVDSALTVAQISGIGNIILGLILLGVPIAFLCNLRRLWKWSIKNEGEIIPILGSVLAGVFALFGCLNTFNLWNWVAVIEPKLWVAHEILKW